MRKIVVLTDLTIDGVMQSPGNPDEDTSGGFTYSGWITPYVDKVLDGAVDEDLDVPFDMLLGLRTYRIFAPYWSKRTGTIADAFNKATKYVVSNEAIGTAWEKTVKISGDDIVDQIKRLKNEDGPMLQVWGSGMLIQTLLKNDLIDELRLRIYPVTIGTGKRLFAEGTIPAAFKLIHSKALPSGVLLTNYAA